MRTILAGFIYAASSWCWFSISIGKSGSPFPGRGEGNTFTREVYNLFLRQKKLGERRVSVDS